MKKYRHKFFIVSHILYSKQRGVASGCLVIGKNAEMTPPANDLVPDSTHLDFFKFVMDVSCFSQLMLMDGHFVLSMNESMHE